MNPSTDCMPDFSGRGLVNVMSAIEARFGGNNPYPAHGTISRNLNRGTKTVVLIVIDGLGYNFYRNHLKHTGLDKFLEGSVTSVFPSTTAAAMTTIYTGLAPLNHGILAWFTYFKELAAIGVMPPMLVRGDKGPLVKSKVDPAALLGISPLFDRITARGFMISPSEYIKKPYNVVASGRGQQVGFRTIDEMLARTTNVVNNQPGEKLVLSYWPGYDQVAHEAGTASAQAIAHAGRVVHSLTVFIESFKPSHPDVEIIITADHGLVDTAPDEVIRLEAHGELKDALAMPLCGEPRAAFCYVRPSRAAQFEEYVERHMARYCTATRIENVIKDGWFGGHEPHPRFFDRAGDYILFMKGSFVIKDTLLGEARSNLVGHHGGTSADEMLVPVFIA